LIVQIPDVVLPIQAAGSSQVAVLLSF